MTSPVSNADLNLIVQLVGSPAWAHAERDAFLEHVASRGAIPQEGPARVSIKPNLISPSQEALLRGATQAIHGALEALVDRVLEDDELQDRWGLTSHALELLQVDPGYSGAIQVARFDGFLAGDALKFLEFNCDSPGGAGRADVLHEAFTALARRNPELGLAGSLDETERLLHLRETLLACYREWRLTRQQDRGEDPVIVVTDWRDVPSLADIEITVRRLAQTGLDVVFCDPRELTLDGDDLVLDDRRVDVVYKRVILDELTACSQASALLEAYQAGTVCLVNAPRSVLAGDKKTLAGLRHPSIQEVLTSAQRAAVERHIPWSQLLEPGRVELDGYRFELTELVRENKDRFVLKAARGYGGRDVLLGFETPAETWARAVEDHASDGDWIVQELVAIPQDTFPTFKRGRVLAETLNVNINPFVFGGRYAGAYTRISKHAKINVSAGGAIAPTITVQAPSGIPTPDPNHNHNPNPHAQAMPSASEQGLTDPLSLDGNRKLPTPVSTSMEPDAGGTPYPVSTRPDGRTRGIERS